MILRMVAPRTRVRAAARVLVLPAALVALVVARPGRVDPHEAAGPPAVAAAPMPGPAGDAHTTALWLFDDTPYPNVILTDAGPHRIDLQLETYRGRLPATTRLPRTMADGSRGLVAGKFGRALSLPIGEGAGVTWPRNSWRRYFIAYMSGRGDEVPERCNLGYFDFTLEFWFKAGEPQRGRGVVWEVRSEGPGECGAEEPQGHGFNALVLDAGRSRFLVVVRVLDTVTFSSELPIATDIARLNDGGWHHLAFTFTKAERQMRHFVDGRLQPLPDKGTFLPMMGRLVSMRVGRDAEGGNELHGALDELRISDIVRYRGDFAPPGSFSRNHGPTAPAKETAPGPALLFAEGKVGSPVHIGGRKHLFLDDVLLESQENVALTANPPLRSEITDFQSEKPWEATPRVGPGIPDLAGIWDDGDQLGMLYTNGGQWGAKQPAVCLARSRDGLHWTKPNLNLVSWDGTRDTNIVLPVASQGAAFRDPNPAARPEERYKFVAWCMMRGFYVFTSPDAVHWRRNETLALPFDPDGGLGLFWDDQCGRYRGYLRASLPPNSFRAIVQAETRDILAPWPFRAVAEPARSQWAMTKPVSGELPRIDTGGEVYRFYASKYPWAPDAYVSFPWRYVRSGNVRPGSFLMTSRDGAAWRRYEPPYYFGAGGKVEGRIVQEALMEPGIVRRGDEVWQYGTIRFTEHGGLLYRGVEHEGGYFDRLVRLVQRLDGFVSLDAGTTPGIATTRPVTFAGRRLVLNVAARGSVRVALTDASGRPLPGFGLDDCDRIRADAVRRTVTWRAGSDVSRWAGKPVRIRFELVDAKLYAFQVVENEAAAR